MLKILDEKLILFFKILQKKYVDFHSFFTELTLLYKGQRMTIEQADGALQKIVMEILELENQAKVLESIKEKPDAKTTRK